MSGTRSTQAAPAATTTITETSGLLDSILTATKQTERDRAQELVKTLVDQALAGTVTFDRNLTQWVEKAVAAIDATLSAQVNAIMHDPKFLKLEGTWRGLHHLVHTSETSTTLKIRVINVSKRALADDFRRAIEFDQSHMFKAVYENGFGIAGGEPFGAMIGDYEWGPGNEDMETLQGIAGVAGSAFAPFLSASAPEMFGMESWTDLNNTRDLAIAFDNPEFVRWRGFRDTEDSRYVSLVLPRVLARVPYGHETRKIDEFEYEETALGTGGASLELPHNDYCWMNAAYTLGTRLTQAFAETGFCTAIRGAEGGGKVEDLPMHTYLTNTGARANKCPTEVNITDRRDAELGKLGFIPLVHYKDTNTAVFFSGQTTQKPKLYIDPDATANAAISTRLPVMMATARFAHYLKIMARDKIGSLISVEDCEAQLNTWINQFVNSNPNVSAELKAKFPLRDARIRVEEVADSPGTYNAVAYLRPWLQLEELNTSLRMVARIPKAAS